MQLKQYHIYIILFSLIVIGYIVYIFSISLKNPTVSEHFTSDSDYASRLEVIKVFDGYLHRNPTMDEIKKYSTFVNEHDILTNVMKDFKIPALKDSHESIIMGNPTINTNANNNNNANNNTNADITNTANTIDTDTTIANTTNTSNTNKSTDLINNTSNNTNSINTDLVKTEYIPNTVPNTMPNIITDIIPTLDSATQNIDTTPTTLTIPTITPNIDINVDETYMNGSGCLLNDGKTKETFDSTGIGSMQIMDKSKKQIKQHLTSVTRAIGTISSSISNIEEIVNNM